ncbi:SDR family oxidoreductase [Marinobacter xestospongiae]|uniref:Peroxisomal trans-2-enoyl-CoA reductase n=1 Tax=Marinobacter xestospongiae TaxID=994319 RepID=A0ABU3VUW4_9GAMM|nr:SDR family oxidoreductase [Marinobacter xestospongiae]MCK7568521.1 SDR family oxidoreductase [Marinobacter xestospongiae]MDV2077777.1 SDR family oxidoreductase [Marinobacter xestospongiae]
MSYQSVLRPGLFEGQTVIVTGGGSGIGRCTAHELASLGARVALVGRKAEKVEAVKAEIEEDGGIASAHVCDIREEESVSATVKAIIQEHGGLHAVVNNAGGQFPSPLTGINQKGWETVVRTNLTGGFLMAREAYTQALSKSGGAIVNIVADMWGGMPGMGHSGAARAGMVNFTQTAAYEWGHSGVRVNAVAPGWIASSGMDNYPAAMRDWIRNLATHVPLKRMGTEAEISAAICFLLSPGAAFINGDCLRIDGGASQGSPIWPLPDANNNEPFNGFHRSSTPKVLSDD